MNKKSAEEVIRNDLLENYATKTVLTFRELHQYNNEWKFRAAGQSYEGDLHATATDYDINIA
jgi:tellurium resistance protein TerD